MCRVERRPKTATRSQIPRFYEALRSLKDCTFSRLLAAADLLGTGLLNRYTVNSRIVGSNPIPSAPRPFATIRYRSENLAETLGFSSLFDRHRSLLTASIRSAMMGNLMGQG